MGQDTGRFREQKAALAVGFLALVVGLLAAYGRPAAGYELSIYAATPPGYWVGVLVATLVALVAAVTSSGRVRDAAHVLATLAVLSVLALPAIRSYAFYGSGDALTHLGWAREMYDGRLSPFEFLYPGLHLVSTFLSELAGVGLARALMVLPVVLFPLAFVLFVALTVGVVTTGRLAGTVGLFSGLLFVPLNLISNHPIAHPSTQTILLVPLVLYLLFRFVEVPESYGPFSSPSGAAVTLAGLAVVVYHPQEAMNLLALFFAVAAGQAIYRRYWPDHKIAEHRRVTPHALLVGAAFLAWTSRQDRARTRVDYALGSLLDRSADTLGQSGSRAASLASLGGTVEEVFLKLFAVTVVFGLLALAALYGSTRGSLYESGKTYASLVNYLGFGLVPVGVLFWLVFVADQGDHYFRFFGFILVSITVLGAVALSVGVDRMGNDAGVRTAAAVLLLAFALMLPMQALVFHHSPYMYQSNQQVTEASLEGHANAFEYRDEEVVTMGIRGGQRRFVDATYGSRTARSDRDFAGYRTSVPGVVFSQNLTRHYDDDRYLVVSDADYQREVELYSGLRYADRGFQTLRTDAAVNRVHTNGDVAFYRIEGSD